MRVLRTALSIVFLAAALGYLAWQSQLEGIADLLRSVSLPAIALAGLLLALSQLLAVVRLRLAARDLGHRLNYRQSFAAVALGGLAGLIAFQILGQIAARGTVFKRSGSSAQAAAAVTLYERAVAAFVSFALATCGAIYLFGEVGFDLDGGGNHLVVTMLGLAITTAAVAGLGWRDLISRYVVPLISWRTTGQLLLIALITLVVQICTLVSLVIVLLQFAADTEVYSLAAAATIVMLAASLPISFAGWGVRELSAVAALGFVGVLPQASVTGSVVFGVLSLTVVATLALWATASSLRGQDQVRSEATDLAEWPVRALQQGRAFEIALCLMTAAFILFQIQVPLERGWVNISPADLPAATIGILALFRFGPSFRKADAVLLFAFLGTGLIMFSYLHGYLTFGKSEWATARVFGWFVLLAYAVAGATLASASEAGGPKRLALTIGIAGAVIVIFSVALGVFTIVPKRLEGFAGNANAMAFQLLVCIGAVLALLRDQRWWLPLVLVLAGGVILTGSLMGVLALTIVGIVGFALVRRQANRSALKPIAMGTGTFVILSTAVDIVYFSTGFHPLEGLFSVRPKYEIIASNLERLRTIIDGWQLFAAHPVFGAGLGYFYEHVSRADGSALVIHSTPIWLLAELGILGFGLAAAFTVHLVRTGVGAPISDRSVLLAVLITAFAIVGLVHDIFYQRVWWFVLGAALAMSRTQFQPHRANLGAV
jgi:uncharacterized membrane protein YbhN (UPF0104 family)